MLSVQPLKSAQGAADYYTAAFNYYASDALAMRWLGRGAEQLGLTGVVEKEQMLALLEGKLPNGQILQNKKGEHRPGFDMTFSAPKSVSILVGLGADKELELFHDKAVELTIRQLEEEFAETRIVKDGKMHFEKTNNFVIAAFRQPSSRANEPALHTHGVTMNMTLDSEGTVRSLASDIHGNRGVVEQLQQNVTYAGLLYRTNLANMMKGKGYQLMQVGDGLFEIDGMPQPVLKYFSTRRGDIEKYMEERGWTGSKAASAATLLTRDNKEEYDLGKLLENWHKGAEELGFNAHEFVSQALSFKERKSLFESVKEFVFGPSFSFKKEELEYIKAQEAVEVAIETVSQKASVFEMRKLREFALKHTLTSNQIVGFQAIDKVIDEKIKDQSLYVGRDPYTQEPALTTPWLLTLEAESLARIESNKGKTQSITSKKEVLAYQKNYDATATHSLTPSQKQAMTQFLTTNDRYIAIQGYAGTGKTTMLKLTRQIAESHGFQLRGMAITSSAANELRSKSGINADVFPIVHAELLHASQNSLKKTVFVVDESSMLSSPQGHELIKLIEQKGARLFLIGDDAQLPTVKNGRIFGLSQEYGIDTTRMVDNVRQRNQSLRDAVAHTIEGQLYDAVKCINEVREMETHAERIEHVARSYLELSPTVREKTLFFAPTHANRREITLLIREGLKREGTLTPNQIELTVLKAKQLEEAQLHYANYYEKGDVIRFNQQSKRFGIERGDYLTVDQVTAVNKKKNTLVLVHENGKRINFRLNELPSYKPTRAGFNRSIEVYQAEKMEIAEGDKVSWTRNFKHDDLHNSESATVVSIDQDAVKFLLENGETKAIGREHAALKHLDYGYVITNMKAQGKDKPYGVGLIESYNQFAATIKNFYVQISRGILNMKIVTDDKTNLIRALEENDDTKKSSIDFVSTQTLVSHQDRFSNPGTSLALDPVIEKKTIKADELHQKMQRIEEYRHSRSQGSLAKRAKIAHEIIGDEALNRLAKAHLGFGYQVYRQDALRFETVKFIETLSKEECKKFNIVKQYVVASKEAQSAWQQAKEINPTPQNKAHALNQSRNRDELASLIANNLDDYKPYLKHYSIGDLNRLGLPQHCYQQEEVAAQLRLERLTKQAEKHDVQSMTEKNEVKILAELAQSRQQEPIDVFLNAEKVLMDARINQYESLSALNAALQSNYNDLPVKNDELKSDFNNQFKEKIGENIKTNVLKKEIELEI